LHFNDDEVVVFRDDVRLWLFHNFRVVTSSSVVAPANLSQSEYKQCLVASSISASDELSSMGVGFGGVGSEANLSERLQMREKKNAQASADPRKQELPPRWQPDLESEPRHATRPGSVSEHKTYFSFSFSITLDPEGPRVWAIPRLSDWATITAMLMMPIAAAP
jgi:hypothetical protein